MRLSIILAVCGAALIWAAGWLGGQANDQLDEYERLAAGDGASTTGTITDARERTQRSRRSTTTTYCPIYTFERSDAGGEPYETTHIERVLCEGEAGDVEMGAEVALIYDPAPDGFSVFVESSETVEALESDAGRNRLLWWLGVAFLSLGVLGIGFIIVEAISSRRSPGPEDPASDGAGSQ